MCKKHQSAHSGTARRARRASGTSQSDEEASSLQTDARKARVPHADRPWSDRATVLPDLTRKLLSFATTRLPALNGLIDRGLHGGRLLFGRLCLRLHVPKMLAVERRFRVAEHRLGCSKIRLQRVNVCLAASALGGTSERGIGVLNGGARIYHGRRGFRLGGLLALHSVICRLLAGCGRRLREPCGFLVRAREREFVGLGLQLGIKLRLGVLGSAICLRRV